MSLRDYFSNNKIFTGTEKPTQGKFGVGDIIVNIGPNSAEEPMWICVEAGTPGVWELCSGVNEEEIGNMNELQTTDKSSIVGAINELFQSANNGKELIANAIGEPVSADDTFQAMSNDINGLLSTFKTNMMNNGITVEANDKFKSLIDKIATMVEEGSGKGIQYAEGTYTRTEDFLPLTTNVVYNLNFTPTFVLLNIGNMVECCANYNMYNIWISNLNQTVIPSKNGDSYSYKLQLTDITNSSFNITNNSTYAIGYINNVKWYAIGVGEEDTTLRDSLADILGDKGVDVTEEDDMASLITKVDSISGGLDIISATELPATGRENQICVITDNPDYGVLVTTNANEVLIDPTIVMYLGNSSSVDTTLGTQVQIDNMMYYFNRVMFGSERLASYIWSNNHWSELTKKYIPLFENGTFPSQDVAGITYVTNTSKYVNLYSDPSNAGNYTISIAGSTSGYRGFSFANYINFANFTKINMTVRTTLTSDQPKLCVTCHNYSSMLGVYEATSISYIHKIDASLTTSFKDISIDISNWTSTGILSFHTSKKATGYIYITRISLE